MKDDDRLVWSSEGGRVREERPAETSGPSGDGVVRVCRETKGRRGKTVTVIRGLDLPPAELDELARSLKKRCGVGGSVSKGAIVIQGDKRELVEAELKARGFTVKLVGG